MGCIAIVLAIPARLPAKRELRTVESLGFMIRFLLLFLLLLRFEGAGAAADIVGNSKRVMGPFVQYSTVQSPAKLLYRSLEAFCERGRT